MQVKNTSFTVMKSLSKTIKYKQMEADYSPPSTFSAPNNTVQKPSEGCWALIMAAGLRYG